MATIGGRRACCEPQFPIRNPNNMPLTPPVSRRDFLAVGGAATAAVAWTASSYAKIIGANDRIRTAFIGVGGMGSGHLDAINRLKEPDNVEAVAVADCWLSLRRKGLRPSVRPTRCRTIASCWTLRRSTTSRSPRPSTGTAA